jgi:hypothetical protein
MCCRLEPCATNIDCGENMVCLSEFCECAKQKYKRLPGPRCVARMMMIQLFFVFRIILAQSVLLETNNTGRVLLFPMINRDEYYVLKVNPVRRTSGAACLRQHPCEHHSICEDKLNGDYKCLCTFGWKGRHCDESN